MYLKSKQIGKEICFIVTTEMYCNFRVDIDL